MEIPPIKQPTDKFPVGHLPRIPSFYVQAMDTAAGVTAQQRSEAAHIGREGANQMIGHAHQRQSNYNFSCVNLPEFPVGWRKYVLQDLGRQDEIFTRI